MEWVRKWLFLFARCRRCSGATVCHRVGSQFAVVGNDFYCKPKAALSTHGQTFMGTGNTFYSRPTVFRGYEISEGGTVLFLMCYSKSHPMSTKTQRKKITVMLLRAFVRSAGLSKGAHWEA